MKFIAKHDIIIGKPPQTRTVCAGQELPSLPTEQLQRLVELGAAVGVNDAADKAARKAADEAAKKAADEAAQKAAEEAARKAAGKPQA